MRADCSRALVVLGVLLILLEVHAGPAHASLIVNGSFEIPDVGPMGIATISVGTGPAGFGWTVDAGNVEVTGELYPPLPGPSFDGQQHLDLNGVLVGALSQTFSTAAGVDYDVSFVYASNYVHHNTTNPALATVRIADVGSGTDLVSPFSISHGTSSSTDLDWTLVVLTFTAIGPDTSLGFTSDSIDTPFGGILLDGVVVVPEPSTLALGVLGLLGLLAFVWRRRRRV
jgi:MYXO-CTERM domain-containing protein